MVFLVSCRPTRNGEMEGTMSRIMLLLLSGLAVGLAFGLSASSSCQPEFPLPAAREEALYRAQPAGYWLQQLRDRDPASRQQAMWALARLGGKPEHVRAVVELLEDQEQGIRFGAALNLGRMGAAAASTVPQLLKASRDADQFVRVAAVRALARICPQDDAVLVALSAALHDKSAMVRCRTLDTLGEIGAPARTLLPAVQEALHDSELEVRQAASEASAKIR
jgi:HEAT repeat protein